MSLEIQVCNLTEAEITAAEFDAAIPLVPSFSSTLNSHRKRSTSPAAGSSTSTQLERAALPYMYVIYVRSGTVVIMPIRAWCKRRLTLIWAVATCAIMAAGALGTGWLTNADSYAPTADPASYMYWVEYMYQERVMMWHGFFSNVQQHHPGPVLYVVLLSGRIVGGFIPWLSIDAGATAAFVITCLLFVFLAVMLISRAYRSTAAGAGVVICYATMILAVDTDSWYTFSSGLRLYPIYGPYLAAHIALAAGAGLIAIAGREKRAIVWTAALGGILFQSFVEIASYGLAIVIICLGVEVARRRNSTVSRWFEHDADIAGLSEHRSDRRHTVALLAALIIGLGPFAMRIVTEGISLPLRYVSGIARARANRPTEVEWPRMFSEPLGTGHLTVLVLVLLAAAVAATAVRRTWRPQAMMAALVYLAMVVYAMFIARNHEAQSSPVAVLPPLMIAPLFALPPRRVRAVLCIAATVLAGWASWSTFDPIDKPVDAMIASTEPVEFADIVEAHLDIGAKVALWTSTGNPLRNPDTSNLLWGSMLEMYRRGFEVCLPSKTNPIPPVGSCGHGRPTTVVQTMEEYIDDTVDTWVILVPTGTERGPGVGSIAGWTIHVVDTPAAIGLIPCKEPLFWSDPTMAVKSNVLEDTVDRESTCISR